MNNLKSIDSVSPVTQKGGKGKNHKKNCKCPICKRGGADPEDMKDFTKDLDLMEKGYDENKALDTTHELMEEGYLGVDKSKNTKTDYEKMEEGKLNVADEEDYDNLEKSDIKLGGTRKRKHKRNQSKKHGSKKHRSGKRHNKSKSKKHRKHRKH